MHFLQQRVVVDLAVALEIDPIDDRILIDLNNQIAALRKDLDIAKTGLVLNSALSESSILTGSNGSPCEITIVGADGIRFYALVALHDDRLDDRLGGRRRTHADPPLEGSSG